MTTAPTGVLIRALRLWREILRAVPPLLPLDVPNLQPHVARDLARSPATPGWILDRMAVSALDDPDLLDLILSHPALPPETVRFLSSVGEQEVLSLLSARLGLAVRGEMALVGGEGAEEEGATDEAGGEQVRSALQLVQRLSVGERLRLALRGNKEVRSILIRDGARTVAMNVLDNPRLSEGEIEQFAKSKQVGEDVLREIAKNREWCRSYGIVAALTGNPKTPPGVALPLLNQMKKKDLENLEKNKNVSEAVRAGAKRLVAQRRT